MFQFEMLLFGILAAITAIVLILLILSPFFIKKYGVVTKAAITKIEAKEKYVDDTSYTQIAYDYLYEYLDCKSHEQSGKLRKNTPYVEFDVGDSIEVIYIRFLPHLSMYKPMYDSLHFLPWIAGLMLFVFLFIIFMCL